MIFMKLCEPFARKNDLSRKLAVKIECCMEHAKEFQYFRLTLVDSDFEALHLDLCLSCCFHIC